MVSLLCLVFAGQPTARAAGFTYQGRLTLDGIPASGLYDLRFTVYDSTNEPGTIVAGPTTNLATVVTEGVFTVQLDFGNAPFDGSDRWLEIAVRTNNTTSFATLSPRQPLTPAPYAIYAASAGPGGTGNTVSGLDAAVGGGRDNTGSGYFSAVGGGYTNTASAFYSTVAGGGLNLSSGSYSTVPGGYQNTAAGDYSLAAGYRAKANHNGTFVWADSQNADFASVTNDEFAIRARNGVRIQTDTGIHMNAADRPIITRDWDRFSGSAAGGKAGIGRWGLFMEPSRLTLGIPSDVDVPGRIFQVAKYSTNGTYTPLLRVDQSGDVGMGAGISSFGASLDIQQPQASLRLLSSNITTSGSLIEMASPANFVGQTIGGIEWTNLNQLHAGISVGIQSGLLGFAEAAVDINSGTGDSTVAKFAPSGVEADSPFTVNAVGLLGGPTVTFNRLSSDGIVLNITRDGTSQGNISVSGSTVSYNAFTGSHYAWTDRPLDEGALVRMTGGNRHYHNDPKSEVIYGIQPTSRANDPACLGAYLGVQSPPQPASSDNPHLVMAVGNGEMWVVDRGGDLEPGDALISSDVKGCAMKDDPKRFAVGHVVARAAEQVSWAEVQPDAQGIRRKKISVLFDSFERGGTDATHLARIVDQQAAEIASLKQRLDTLQTIVLQKTAGASADVAMRQKVNPAGGPVE